MGLRGLRRKTGEGNSELPDGGSSSRGNTRYALGRVTFPSPEILDAEMAVFHERMAKLSISSRPQHQNPGNPGVRQFAGQTAQRSGNSIVERRNNISVVTLLAKQIVDYDDSNQIRRVDKFINLIETPLGATGLHVSNMPTPGHVKGVSFTTVAALFRISKQKEPNYLPKNVTP